MRIIAGSPSDEELAAVVAVLTTSLDALASENREQLDAAEARPGAWRRSQRAPRRGVTLGAWRTFGR
ncbi:acyl-CoA carboxylase subunit epsilon [Schumannella luteola]|nr:acyl-CoA carboxylase subunit epsilon [Schumannella luteola]